MLDSFANPLLCPTLIGRQGPVQALQYAVDQTRHRGGTLMLLAGEAGIGKSRLIGETRSYATRQGFLVLEGQCFPTDSAIPYAPFVDLGRQYLAGQPFEELDPTVQPLLRNLVRWLPDIAPHLSPGAAPAAEPAYVRRQVNNALGALFTAQAQHCPVFVIIEDLHWADDASLDVLVHLARTCRSHEFLLACTYRSDEPQPDLTWLAQLDRERLIHELTVTPLDKAEVEAMIRAVLGQQHGIPQALTDRIYALSEGNPFFVEELLTTFSTVSEKSIAKHQSDQQHAQANATPRSVRAAVQQRSALLSSAAREILTLAAVAGRRIDFALLQALTGEDEPNVLAIIKELIAARLLVEEAPDRFAFRHALIREAVYQDLLARERRLRHRRIAEALEQHIAASHDPAIADLAYHFTAAEAWPQALDYGRRAAVYAQARYAPRAAVDHASRALGAASHLNMAPTRDLYRLRGQANATLGDFEQAQADFEQALQLAQGDGIAAQCEALLDLGKLWAARDYRQAGRYIQAALELARILADPHRLAHSLNQVGNWHVNIEQPIQALRYHHEALTIFEQLDDLTGMTETHDLLGMAHYLGGDLLTGTQHYEQSVVGFRALDQRQGLASSLATMTLRGGAYQTSTMVAAIDLATAAHTGQQALTIAQQIDWRAGEAYALIFLSFCLGGQGRYQEALQAAQEGLAIAEAIDHHQWTTAAHCALSAIFLDVLAAPEACRHGEEALALAQSIGSSHWISCAAGYLASAYVVLGEYTRAETTLNIVCQPTTPAQTLGQRLAWCAYVELAIARGNATQALLGIDRLAASTANCAPDVLHRVPRLAQLQGMVLGLQSAAGQTTNLEAAEQLLRKALQTAEQQCARPMAWRLLVALGNLYHQQARFSECDQACAAARSIIEELASDLQDARRRDVFLRRAVALLPPTQRRARRRVTSRSVGGLTARECEVAIEIARGKTNQEIAAALVVSERTVESHVSNILAKLNATSRQQIAAWATAHQLCNNDA